MINVKFAVETKDGNWFENINSIKECFEHDVKKIYETTFGSIETKQLLIYYNNNNQYYFNFMNGYFSIEALYQLQVYNAKHKIMYNYHMKLVETEIDIMLGKECTIEIGVPIVSKRRKISNGRKANKTTLKNILEEYQYHQSDSIILDIMSIDGTYVKSLVLKRDNGLSREEVNFNRFVKGKCSCRPYGANYKWLDYLQTIDYTD